jgi:putative PIN family toxin of toxin-antitoxin system
MMRVMLDTNILISAVVLKSVTLNKMPKIIIKEHKLVLSSYVIEELKEVVARRFKDRAESLDEFLIALPYEFVYTPDVMTKDLFEIRDMMDYPVLYTAIIEDVDVLVTGDKDFADVEVEKGNTNTS